MVQATYLSDQKHDLTQLRHDALNTQNVVRRRKVTQSRRESDLKSPTASSASRYHHVTLYVDKKGNIQTDCSSTITHEERLRISQAAMPKYRQAVERIKANSTQMSFAIKTEAAGSGPQAGLQCQSSADNLMAASDFTTGNVQSLKRPNKRPRSSSEDGSSYLQDDSSSHPTERPSSSGTVENQSNLIPIEIQDSEKLKEYLFDAFTSFQQINCRTLCKSWIRMIEPKKQVNHPYNGNLKVKGLQKFPSNDLSTQKDSDPEETKPKWWPSKDDCPHKEPDHIKKEQRLALLCHILMNTRDLHDCSTEDLRQAIRSDRAKIKPTEKELILEDVWTIGNQLERFKDGEMDGSSIIYVHARKEEARMIRGGGRLRKPFDARDESEDEESSGDPECGPDEVKTLTPTTPSALASSVPYLNEDQASLVPQIHPDGCGYTETRSTNHFRPCESKHNYQEHQTEYPTPVEVNPPMGDVSHHGPSGNVFDGESFAQNSFGDLPALHSHADLFSPEQQVIGHWAISGTPDLYPMHYTGEPSQPPAVNPTEGDHVFGHYPYESPHKQIYRNGVHGFAADGHSHFPAEYEDDLARFQRINACSFPSHSTQRVQSANMMHQHSYDLPSHVRT